MKRLPVLLLLLFPLALFLPALAGGKMLWGMDIQTLTLFFNQAVRRSLNLGEFPLWTPELLCGMPGIASTGIIFFHPVELACHLLQVPVWASVGIDAALEIAASGLGTYFLLRRLGLSRGACLVGAFAYAASGTQLSLLYAGHVNNLKAIAMIPWVFWGALKGWQEARLLGWALGGAALALQILGSGMQIFAYTLIGFAAFAAWLAWGGEVPLAGARDAAARTKAALRGVAAAGLAAFLLSAPQLLPTLQYGPWSWRDSFNYETFISWSFHPKESLAWIVPGYWGWRNGPPSAFWPEGATPAYHGSWAFCLTSEYFGLLPWALAFAAVAAAWKGLKPDWRKPQIFLVALAAFSFVSALGKYFPLHLVYYHLPVYGGFRTWTRFLCLCTFSVCALAAYGFDALKDSAAWPRALRGAFVFVALAVVCATAALVTAPDSVAGDSASLARQMGPSAPSAALQLARDSGLRALILAAMLGVCLVLWPRIKGLGPALVGAALLFHAVDVSEVWRRFLDFQDPARALAAAPGLEALPAAAAGSGRILDLPGAWTQNAAALQGYEQCEGYHGMEMSAPMRLAETLKDRRLEWSELLGARWLVSPQPIQAPGFRALNAGAPYVYENPNALPRAFLCARSVPVEDSASAWAALGAPNFDVLGTVTVEKGPRLDFGGVPGSVLSAEWGRNSCTIVAEAAVPALLVVSQSYYPSWGVRVDGRPAPLLKADGGALQAVALAPGRHTVELVCGGTLVWVGLALAGLGVAGLALLAAGKWGLSA